MMSVDKLTMTWVKRELEPTQTEARATPYLIMVGLLSDETHEPVLIPEVQNCLSEVAWQFPALKDVQPSSGTHLFHVMRDFVSDGLLAHTNKGYLLTDRGRAVVDRISEERPDVIVGIQDAAKAVTD